MPTKTMRASLVVQMVRKSACNTEDPGLIPWRREWQHTPVFLPEEFHGQRSLVGYSLRGRKASDRTEPLTLSLSSLSQTHVAYAFI